MSKQEIIQAEAEKQATHKNVYTALAAAQAQMGPLIKGASNPHFKSKYADLADLVQAVRAPLNSNGLTFFHQIIKGEGARDMRTVLMHGESETSIECDVELIVAKNDMQGMKSATTYAKRIGLESVTGVAPEDDDGNAAVAAAPKRDAKAQIVTPDQYIKLRDTAEAAGVPAEKICAAYSAPSFEQFPAADFMSAMARLQKTIDAAKQEHRQEEAAREDGSGNEPVPNHPHNRNADLGSDSIPY